MASLRYEQEEADAAAAEAAQIGGFIDDDGVDPAQRAVIEAGGGVSEGFEQAEQALIDHASHADQQAAHAILHDRGRPEEWSATRQDADSDYARSSELSVENQE
jgi:hypothetical protein